MSGGRLRKVVSSFKDEVDPATGIFTSNANIVKTFDNLRIRGFNNGRTNQSYRGGWVVDRGHDTRANSRTGATRSGK